MDVCEVEFTDESPCHCMSVQYRHGVAHGPCLEGVPQGVSQVECLAYMLLRGVLLHDVLLHADRLHDELLQGVEVEPIQVVAHQSRPVLLGADESVLEHLSKARCDVVCVERVQKLCRHHHRLGGIEGSHLILQRMPVDTRLASYGSVHHGQ